MDVNSFRKYQREHATHNLSQLLIQCRDKFLDAARLLEIENPAIEHCKNVGYGAVELWPFLNMYDEWCERYELALFSPQTNLFLDNEEREDVKWQRYYFHELLPQLLRDHHFVKNVLRAMKALPGADPALLSRTLHEFAAECYMPRVQPKWAY